MQQKLRKKDFNSMRNNQSKQLFKSLHVDNIGMLKTKVNKQTLVKGEHNSNSLLEVRTQAIFNKLGLQNNGRLDLKEEEKRARSKDSSRIRKSCKNNSGGDKLKLIDSFIPNKTPNKIRNISIEKSASDEQFIQLFLEYSQAVRPFIEGEHTRAKMIRYSQIRPLLILLGYLRGDNKISNRAENDIIMEKFYSHFGIVAGDEIHVDDLFYVLMIIHGKVSIIPRKFMNEMHLTSHLIGLNQDECNEIKHIFRMMLINKIKTEFAPNQNSKESLNKSEITKGYRSTSPSNTRIIYNGKPSYSRHQQNQSNIAQQDLKNWIKEKRQKLKKAGSLSLAMNVARPFKDSSGNSPLQCYAPESKSSFKIPLTYMHNIMSSNDLDSGLLLENPLIPSTSTTCNFNSPNLAGLFHPKTCVEEESGVCVLKEETPPTINFEIPDNYSEYDEDCDLIRTKKPATKSSRQVRNQAYLRSTVGNKKKIWGKSSEQPSKKNYGSLKVNKGDKKISATVLSILNKASSAIGNSSCSSRAQAKSDRWPT